MSHPFSFARSDMNLGQEQILHKYLMSIGVHYGLRLMSDMPKEPQFNL
jgi:hypothetical protein